WSPYFLPNSASSFNTICFMYWRLAVSSSLPRIGSLSLFDASCARRRAPSSPAGPWVTLAQFAGRDCIELMVAVMEIEHLLQPQTACNLKVVLFVVQDNLAHRGAAARHFVVAGSNQNAAVAFFD